MTAAAAEAAFYQERLTSFQTLSLRRGIGKILKFSAPRWMTQLAERFRLDLADSLAGHLEFGPHLFKCSWTTVIVAIPQAQDSLLASV